MIKKVLLICVVLVFNTPSAKADGDMFEKALAKAIEYAENPAVVERHYTPDVRSASCNYDQKWTNSCRNFCEACSYLYYYYTTPPRDITYTLHNEHKYNYDITLELKDKTTFTFQDCSVYNDVYYHILTISTDCYDENSGKSLKTFLLHNKFRYDKDPKDNDL